MRALITTLLLAFVVSALGCDNRPKRVPIAGRVLVAGQPAPFGTVKFVPEGGRPSSGKIGPDGSFELRCYDSDDGALVGTHRVAVSVREVRDEKVKWAAPKKYADFRTSGLVHEVTGPDDNVVIELSSDGPSSPSGPTE